MNELRRLILLNARWYEFLGQQADSTLEAMIAGAGRLAFVRDDQAFTDAESREDVRTGTRPEPVGPATSPPRDPYQAAQVLPTLASEHERRAYLTATRFTVKELREVAKLCGLSRYSKLARAGLVNLLSGETTGEPRDPIGSDSTSEQATTAQKPPPSNPKPPSGVSVPKIDAAAVASHLRDTDTEEEGAAYLDEQQLDREGLLSVATELQLTRVERLPMKELRKRVLKQAIGARRKFAGLRKW